MVAFLVLLPTPLVSADDETQERAPEWFQTACDIEGIEMAGSATGPIGDLNSTLIRADRCQSAVESLIIEELGYFPTTDEMCEGLGLGNGSGCAVFHAASAVEQNCSQDFGPQDSGSCGGSIEGLVSTLLGPLPDDEEFGEMFNWLFGPLWDLQVMVHEKAHEEEEGLVRKVDHHVPSVESEAGSGAETILSQGGWYVQVPKSDDITMRMAPTGDVLDLTQVGGVGLVFPSDPAIFQDAEVDLMPFEDGILIDSPPPGWAEKALMWGACGASAAGAVASWYVAAKTGGATWWLAAGATAGAAVVCASAYQTQNDKGAFACSGGHEVTWGGIGGNGVFKNTEIGIVGDLLAIEESSDHQGGTSQLYPWVGGGSYDAGRSKCEKEWEAARLAANEDAKSWRPTEGFGMSSISALVEITPVTQSDVGEVIQELRDESGALVGQILTPATQEAGVVADPADLEEALGSPLLVWDCSDSCPPFLELVVSSCGDGATVPQEGGVEYEFLGDPMCFTIQVRVDGQNVVPPTNLPLVLRAEFEGEGNNRMDAGEEV